MRACQVSAISLFPLFLVSPAAGQVQFTPLAVPPNSSATFALSSDRTGSSFGGYFHATSGPGGSGRVLVLTATGEYTDLGLLPGASFTRATAISGHGHALAGHGAIGGQLVAFRWTADAGLQQLPLPAGITTSQAWAISHDGTRIAGYMGPTTQELAIVWTPQGPVQIPLEPGHGRSFAVTVSGDGSTVGGYYINPTGRMTGFRWTEAQGVTHPIMDTATWSHSWLYDLNVDGSVGTGAIRDVNGSTWAYRWTQNGGVQPLYELGLQATPASISGDGSVIVGGYYGPADDWRPFMWTVDGGLTDLLDLLTEHEIDLTGWSSFRVRDVSGDGRVIVGDALFPGPIGNQWRPWMIVVPSPAAAAAFVVAAMLARPRRRDAR